MIIPAVRFLQFADGDLMKHLAYTGASAGKAFERIPAGVHSRRAVSAPGALTGALAGAGAGNVDNGVHKYRVTFLTSEGETEGGTVSADVTVVDKTINGKVALSAIPTGPTKYVWGRRIYRTKAGGSTYFLLTTLEDNTTTTYTDNTADSGLPATQAPTVSTADFAMVLRRPRKIIARADDDVRIVWGTGSTPTAVAGDDSGILLTANLWLTILVPPDVDHLAAISNDGTSTGSLIYGYRQLNFDRY